MAPLPRNANSSLPSSEVKIECVSPLLNLKVPLPPSLPLPLPPLANVVQPAQTSQVYKPRPRNPPTGNTISSTAKRNGSQTVSGQTTVPPQFVPAVPVPMESPPLSSLLKTIPE